MSCLRHIFYFLCFTVHILQSAAHDGSPYGLIDAVQTECEYQALTWGTRLTDAWNSYDESIPFKDRFGHDFYYQSASFSKMIHFEMVRRPELFEGVPHHHKHVVHKPGMHKGAPPFHPLLDKWIYMLGDSSLYSVWMSIRGPIQGINLFY
ncbi:hypothetical protein EON65_15500 [archaeon]|nr:MAG: hypothetical protein EON65_15500 [archaeon]